MSSDVVSQKSQPAHLELLHSNRSFLNKLVLGFFLIIVLPSLALLISELNNRVTAETFAREELQAIRADISQLPRITTAVQGSPGKVDLSVTANRVSSRLADLELRKERVISFQKGLTGLNVAGAKSDSGTVYMLVWNYLGFVQDQLERSSSIAAANVLTQGLEQEIAFIEQVLPSLIPMTSTDPNNSGNARDLLRATSARIPVIQEIEFQSHGLVQVFDFQIIRALQNFEENPSEENGLISIFNDLKGQAVTLRDQLMTRKEELSREISVTQNPAVGLQVTDESISSDGVATGDPTLNSYGWFSFVSIPVNAIAVQSTTLITVALGLLSGCLGALFLGLVSRDGNAFLYLAKGAVAGVVAIFVVKGGNTLLSINISDGLDVANPFSVAFVGFLVGVFSDRFFEYLKNIVDKAALQENGDHIVSPNNEELSLDEKRAQRVQESLPDDAKANDQDAARTQASSEQSDERVDSQARKKSSGKI